MYSSRQGSLSPNLSTICNNMDHHAWTLYSFCCLVLHCMPTLQFAYTWVTSYEPLVWVLCEYTYLFCFDVHPGVSPSVLWSLCLACWRITLFFSIFHSSSVALSLVTYFIYLLFWARKLKSCSSCLHVLSDGIARVHCLACMALRALPCVHGLVGTALCALPCLGTTGS